MLQESIFPGQPWLDTNGNAIQAHGGAVYYEDGIYYWYGENKEHTDGASDVWTWGIKVYSSRDLCNWQDEGYLVEPDVDDPASPLHPSKRVDRPHILRCPQTGRYVLWLKLSGKDACFVILSSERLLGPYQMENPCLRPEGSEAGDFDMVQDSASGKAYLYVSINHSDVVGYALTADYLNVQEEVSRQYGGLHSPFTREGIAVFEHAGKKYMLTSGMSGYIPNRSDSAVSGSWEEPFVSLGNPHVNDDSRASFNSQISKVFRVEGTDQLIAMADRWVPDYPVDAHRADLFERAIAAHFEPEKYHVLPEEKRELMNSPMLQSANTSRALYVWLPIRWERDMPQIDWLDCWRPQLP